MEDIITDPIEVAKTLENIPTITPDRMHCPICFSPVTPFHTPSIYHCDFCNALITIKGNPTK